MNKKQYIKLKTDFSNNPTLAVLKLVSEIKNGVEEKTNEILEKNIGDFKSKLEKEAQKIIREKIGFYKGERGLPGIGKDGYTPKKGVDYFTEREIKQIVEFATDEAINFYKSREKDLIKLAAISVIKQIPIPKDGRDGKDGKDAKEETGKSVVDKINSLPATPAFQIDASHIKNLPVEGPRRSGGGGMTIRPYDLSDLCDGATKTFSIPANNGVLSVSGTQFPRIYRPLIDFTYTNSQLLLTSQVGAPEAGQTLVIQYIEA